MATSFLSNFYERVESFSKQQNSFSNYCCSDIQLEQGAGKVKGIAVCFKMISSRNLHKQLVVFENI